MYFYCSLLNNLDVEDIQSCFSAPTILCTYLCNRIYRIICLFRFPSPHQNPSSCRAWNMIYSSQYPQCLAECETKIQSILNKKGRKCQGWRRCEGDKRKEMRTEISRYMEKYFNNVVEDDQKLSIVTSTWQNPHVYYGLI